MAVVQSNPAQDGRRASGGHGRQVMLGAAAGLALVVVLWGGYSHHWPWTGINGGTATLWDWLHLLMLPLAVAVLPVWFSRQTRVHPRTKAYGSAAGALFVALVILGYAVPWAWTGFRGNTLWDWFGLMFLPLPVVLMPGLLELREDWQARHSAVAGTVLTVFAIVVLGGYLGHWTWTGFTGNTLWNWMNLLFLPLLLPTVIVPALKPMATGRIVYVDEDGQPIEPAPAAGTPTVEPPAAAAPADQPPRP